MEAREGQGWNLRALQCLEARDFEKELPHHEMQSYHLERLNKSMYVLLLAGKDPQRLLISSILFNPLPAHPLPPSRYN